MIRFSDKVSTLHLAVPEIMMVFLVIVVGLVCLVATTFVVKKRKGRRLPPGPFGLPVLGKTIGFNPDTAYITVSEWQKEHGDIMAVKLFGQNVLFIAHPDKIRLAFESDEFGMHMSDRPPSFLGDYVSQYDDVLMRRYDETCQKLKQMTIKSLEKSNENSAKFLNLMKEEIMEILSQAESSNGKNFNLVKAVNRSLCKLIGLMFTGRRLEETDPILLSVREFEYYGDQMVQPRTHAALKLCPFIRHVPGLKYRTMCKAVFTQKDNLRKLLIEPIKKGFSEQNGVGLIHSLVELQEEECWLKDEHILGIVMDLITTSVLTSMGVLSGFFLLLVNFPEMQRKIQNEIDHVIGRKRQPEPEDLRDMHYTHACILEALRYQAHLPMTATHSNLDKDVEFDGYHIPKGTKIFGCQWSVHHDERFWKDPWTFKPERFLDDEGKLLPPEHDLRQRYYMPFGVGHRACVGQDMTYNRMFLYSTMILQHYDILPPRDQDLPSHDPRCLLPGTVLMAPEFLCSVNRRHCNGCVS